jgi:hypothetical protein
MSATVTFAESIYPVESFRTAATAYEGICTARVVTEGTGEYEVELAALAEGLDETMLVHEFLNYMLDLSAEYYLTAGEG